MFLASSYHLNTKWLTLIKLPKSIKISFPFALDRRSSSDSSEDETEHNPKEGEQKSTQSEEPTESKESPPPQPHPRGHFRLADPDSPSSRKS